MQNNGLLDKLKDIYLPERISQWWPLAYGWWLIIAAAILIIIIILLLLHKKKKHKLYVESIIKDFRVSVENITEVKPGETLQVISVYLKRVAMQRFTDENIKTLHGKAWLDFLDSKSKSRDFNSTQANLLANSYKLQELDKATLKEITLISEKWLRKVI